MQNPHDNLRCRVRPAVVGFTVLATCVVLVVVMVVLTSWPAFIAPASSVVIVEADISRLTAELDMLDRNPDESPIFSSAGLRRYPAGLDNLHAEYLEEKRQLAAKKLSGLGDSHPDVKQQQVVEARRRDFDESVAALPQSWRPRKSSRRTNSRARAPRMN